MFTDKEHRGPFAFSEELGNLSIGEESNDNIASAQIVQANDKDLLLSTSEREESKGPSNNGSDYSAPASDASATQGQMDLVSIDYKSTTNAPSPSFAIDDLLGLGLPTVPTPAPPPLTPALSLIPKAVLAPNVFQQKWRQLPISISQVQILIVCLHVLADVCYTKWML